MGWGCLLDSDRPNMSVPTVVKVATEWNPCLRYRAQDIRF